MSSNPTGLVSLSEEEAETQTRTEGDLVQTRGDDRHLQARGRAWGDQPCRHLGLRLPASRAVRKSVPVALATQSVVLRCGHPSRQTRRLNSRTSQDLQVPTRPVPAFPPTTFGLNVTCYRGPFLTLSLCLTRGLLLWPPAHLVILHRRNIILSFTGLFLVFSITLHCF